MDYVTWYFTNVAKALLLRWPVAFLWGGTDAFLKSTKTDLRRGRWDEGCLKPCGIHQEGCTIVIVSTVDSGSRTEGSTPILRLSPNLSLSDSSTSAFPPPTKPRSDDGSTPTQPPPAPCSVSFPPPGYMPLLIPCPSPPCAHPHSERAQGRMGSVGGQDGAC